MDISNLIPAGEFSNQILNRRTIRSHKNPMDKCTIISILPKAIDEVKYTIEPGKFHIDSGTYESPSILVVGGSSWWKDVDADQPLLAIPVSSTHITGYVIIHY